MLQPSIIVIGGGSIGRRHLRNLQSLGQTQLALVEVNAGRALELEREFRVPVYSSLTEALAARSFRAAVICSPSVYHLEQARECARQGLDLFIEKPLSHSFTGVSEFLESVRTKQLITLVGSNWKFYPSFQKIKALLSSGAIGTILSARCQFGQYLPDWHPTQDYRQGYSAQHKLGGGILLDSHEFDYLTWFMGEPVKKITCFAGTVSKLEIDVEDAAAIILQFSSGALGEIHLDYLQRFYQRNFEFFGSTGTLLWDYGTKTVVLRQVGQEPAQFPLAPDYELNAMYVDEMCHFLKAVETRAPTVTPLESGVEVLRLIVSAKESAITNRTVFF